MDAGTTGPQTVTVTVVEGRGYSAPALTASIVAWQSTAATSWTVLTASNGVYSFSVPSAQAAYRLAVVCPDSQDPANHVVEATPAELSALRISCPPTPQSIGGGVAPKFQSGVTGTPSSIFVNLKGYSTGLPTNGSVMNAVPSPKGVYDVAAAEYDSGTKAVRGVLNHDTVLNTAGQLLYLNFLTGFDFDTHTLTLAGGEPADGTLNLTCELETKEGSSISLGFGTASPLNIRTAPSSALVPGDIHRLRVEASGSDLRSRSALRMSVDGGDFSLSPPDYLVTATVAATQSSPHVVLSANWSGGPGDAALSLQAYELPNSYDYLLSPAVVTSVKGSYAVPDLSALPGWDTSRNLVNGTALRWYLDLVHANQGMAGLTTLYPTYLYGRIPDGLELQVSTRSDMFTP